MLIALDQRMFYRIGEKELLGPSACFRQGSTLYPHYGGCRKFDTWLYNLFGTVTSLEVE